MLQILITKEMTVDDSVRFNNEDEIIDHMLMIANESFELAQKLRAEDRELTHDEGARGAGVCIASNVICHFVEPWGKYSIDTFANTAV